MDYHSGRVLYVKEADRPLAPASLAKLITMGLVFEQLQKGNFELDSTVPISKKAWKPYLPKGSSLMFIAPGHQVTVRELLLGVAVCSGNDAAIALAEFISGTQKSFVQEMNDKMKDLGFELFFADCTGLHPGNRITALEFAKFVRVYLENNRQALAQYHSVRQMTYPKRHNVVRSQLFSPVRQDNRNSLLASYPGLDGLKTGYIKQAGYNIALTALRDGTRLIAVVLGAPGLNQAQGIARRNRDGKMLLDYGFKFFKTVAIAPPLLKPQRVWYGHKDWVQGHIAEEFKITIARRRSQYLRSETHYLELTAPIRKNQVIGTLAYYIGLKKIAERPILAKENIKEGSFFEKMFDKVTLLFVE